jgi:hypothetical protein
MENILVILSTSFLLKSIVTIVFGVCVAKMFVNKDRKSVALKIITVVSGILFFVSVFQPTSVTPKNRVDTNKDSISERVYEQVQSAPPLVLRGSPDQRDDEEEAKSFREKMIERQQLTIEESID